MQDGLIHMVDILLSYVFSTNPLLLAHEITHTFGIEHHQRQEGQPCIMDDARYDDISFDPESNLYNIWCSDCLQIIKNNRLKY